MDAPMPKLPADWQEHFAAVGRPKPGAVPFRFGTMSPDLVREGFHELHEWNGFVLDHCSAPMAIQVQEPDNRLAPTERLGSAGRPPPYMLLRCRQLNCQGCMIARQIDWQYRATVEYLLHPRTWWCTLTWADGAKVDEDGNSIPADYEDVKTFLKRLREAAKRNGSSTPIRYVLSEEYGDQGGRLHWHALVHCDEKVTKRLLESAWWLGHTKVRLAKTGGLGGYLAKYVAKNGRIRASGNYGKGPRLALVQGQVWERFGREVLSDPESRFSQDMLKWIKRQGVKPPLSVLRQMAPSTEKAVPF